MARILIIDDNEAFRASITDLLEGVGHDVATAADGEDGVDSSGSRDALSRELRDDARQQ